MLTKEHLRTEFRSQSSGAQSAQMVSGITPIDAHCSGFNYYKDRKDLLTQSYSFQLTMYAMQSWSWQALCLRTFFYCHVHSARYYNTCIYIVQILVNPFAAELQALNMPSL